MLPRRIRALRDDLEPAAIAEAGSHARKGRRGLRAAGSTGQAQDRWPDPNDMLYQYDCSRDYNPEPHLEEIKAPLYAVNSADDQVNPPELGILEREIKRVKRGRYILIPTSDQTRGHGTHSLPAIWGNYLDELLKESASEIASAAALRCGLRRSPLTARPALRAAQSQAIRCGGGPRRDSTGSAWNPPRAPLFWK